MSDKDKNDKPEQLDNSSQEDFNEVEASQTLLEPNAESISASPSILRPINTPRRDVSNAPSIVLSLPVTEWITCPKKPRSSGNEDG